MKTTILAIILCFVAAPSARSQDVEVPSEAFLHGMSVAAQRVYEQASRMHHAGRSDLADAFFQQSLDILVEADQRSGGVYRSRFDRIYAKYFERRAEYDEKAAGERIEIETSIESAYQEQPMLPGQVHYMIRYMATQKKSFLENSFRRSLRYIPMIQRVFESQGLPPDLAYMALVESGFRPDPTSHAGAQGLWQFMPATARQYGLRVESGIDERNDPEKATVAAAKYLTYLHRKFDNWTLAVAAYNAGEGRIGRLLQQTGSKTFWDLVEADALPDETEKYVPSIIAATIISRDPASHGIDYP